MNKGTSGFSFILIFFSIVCLFSVIDSHAGNQPNRARGKDSPYRIGKGDILRVTTWKEPSLSVERTSVRLDGKITMPLLNDIQAAGLTPMELKMTIEKRLQKFIDAPVVTVTLLEIVSQKYYVLGEVVRVGEYALSKHMNIMQAFAVAGGFTEWASKKEILLFRIVDGEERIFRINYKNIMKGKDFSGNITIQADDTIVVP